LSQAEPGRTTPFAISRKARSHVESSDDPGSARTVSASAQSRSSGLVGVLIADVVYVATADPFWATASFWLLGFGIVMGLLAGLLGFIDFATLPPARSRTGWTHLIGNLAAIAISAVNLWLRLGDPAAAVLPTGLVLSVVVGAILVVTGWAGGELSYRHKIGVIDE
jgi:uncharacterized membrane protein